MYFEIVLDIEKWVVNIFIVYTVLLEQVREQYNPILMALGLNPGPYL